MSNNNIETVIFDLGGVLVDWNPTYLYKKIFKDEEEMNFFLENICAPGWNAKQDEGRSLSEATETLISEHPKYENEIRAFYGRWEEMLGGVIEGTENILNKIAENGKYRLYALTNWSAETLPIAMKKYGFFKRFEGIVVSGQEKINKPDYELYRILFRRYHVDPNKAIYIDDSEKNVKAALELGLRAIHFQNPKQLKKALLEAGIRMQD